MSDPHVREIGAGIDMAGDSVAVAAEWGTVTVRRGSGEPWQFTVEQADEIAALLITACWQAADQRGSGNG